MYEDKGFVVISGGNPKDLLWVERLQVGKVDQMAHKKVRNPDTVPVYNAGTYRVKKSSTNNCSKLFLNFFSFNDILKH